MKYMVAIFLLLLACQSQAQDVTDTIHWRPEYKLKSADFKGVSVSSSEFSAISSISFKISSRYITDTSISFRVYCVFNKSRSWIKNRSDDSYLLKHEQGHFDLAEVYRRKLQDSLNGLGSYNYIENKTFIDQQVRSIKEHILGELDLLDRRYDSDTDLSQDHVQQDIWTKKIDSLLRRTDQFPDKN